MKSRQNKGIQWAYIIFWLLLIYIVASQIFWFLSLTRLSDELINIQIHNLDAGAPNHQADLATLLKQKTLKRWQYIGEGIFVLMLLLAGALYVYFMVRKQLREATREANFLMAITHELKTPIAVTKLNLETLQRHNLDEEKKNMLIQNSLSETNRLNDLCNNLLISSQLDSNRYHISNEVQNLSAIVINTVNGNQQRWPHRIIETDIEEDVELKGDKLLFGMLVTNLVENALKYSPKKSPVVVRLRTAGAKVILQVIDEGPGIPVEEKSRVFEKHYRIGNEATKRSKGTGLGLYLVDRIVGKYHATVSISDNKPQGSIFNVIFENLI